MESIMKKTYSSPRMQIADFPDVDIITSSLTKNAEAGSFDDGVVFDWEILF